MLNSKSLSLDMINKIIDNSDKFILKIDKNTNILGFNEAFEPFIKSFSKLKDLITFAHLDTFLEHIESLNKDNNVILFNTNFSFNKVDVEDLPDSYKIVAKYIDDNNILLLAEQLPHLSHEDARSYFELINDYSNMQRDLKKSKIKLKDLNKNLEEKVKIEVDKNVKTQMQIFESSKLASMGEMIGNIAHQWRQPLYTVTLLADTIKIKNSFGKLDTKEVDENMTQIIEIQDHLSDTINTFRNFLKEKKELISIVLQDRVDKALTISNTILKDKHIKLIKDIDYTFPIQITTIPTELMEVVINIINNAIDIIEEKNISDGWVKVSIKDHDNKAIISIEDNGGGIPEHILPNIFNEYFTTKSQDKGTGLGLYMSKKIVQDSLNGNLYVKNSESGAKFYIELNI
jgi:C4-dicarboxylate-specific signal transduction histidine kinase